MSITKDLFEFVKRDSDGLYSLSISENGKTETFKRILANDTNNIYSVSKVFTVTAIGFLADAGLLSLDEKISDIFRMFIYYKLMPYDKRKCDQIV